MLLSSVILMRHLRCGNNLHLIDEILEIDWSRKWLVDFHAEETHLIPFGRCNNTGVIIVKMDESVLGEISTFKMLGLSFFSKSNWGSYIFFIAETYFNKNGALTHSM